ncbi:unnamed protein product, partial [Protopolystoma xenopodis]
VTWSVLAFSCRNVDSVIRLLEAFAISHIGYSSDSTSVSTAPASGLAHSDYTASPSILQTSSTQPPPQSLPVNADLTEMDADVNLASSSNNADSDSKPTATRHVATMTPSQAMTLNGSSIELIRPPRRLYASLLEATGALDRPVSSLKSQQYLRRRNHPHRTTPLISGRNRSARSRVMDQNSFCQVSLFFILPLDCTIRFSYGITLNVYFYLFL